ncbi:DUF3883 domain-containing protein [Parabacteroides sp. OttesenSCG-928-J18]|nr:DUF3883 domain-containing protein [Parabacteroides sp. OttesenSCG-928-J18]
MEQHSKKIRESWAKEQKRQFCKQSCTKISQGLDNLDLRSGERAIWELFQNARDLAKRNGDNIKEAHIKISLTPTEFIFAHKGRPFTHDSLNSLVMQVSSREKEDEESVGQYGTGFLTTHVFGRRLFLTGSLDMEEHASGKYADIDNFEIDRTFEDIPEFIDKMADQLIAVENFAEAALSTKCREWTELRYQLASAGDAREKVRKAIDTAIKIMPYVMTINTPIIDVEIVDEENSESYFFRKELLPTEKDLYVMGISVSHNNYTSLKKIYYLQSEDKRDIAILPLKDANTAQSLEGIAKLFVYFPLLGTEDFGMDVIFHSHRFFPVEKRDALHLPVENVNVKAKYESNIKVLEEMSDMVFVYLRSHVETISNWVDITKLTFDCIHNKQEVTNEYIRSFKKKWSSFYESLPIIEVKGCKKSIASKEISLLSEEVATVIENENCWLKAIYLAASNCWDMPSENTLLDWSKVVDTWDTTYDCFLTHDRISESLSKNRCNDNVLLLFGLYLKHIGLTHLFDKYALIPNRAGELKLKSSLKDASSIPSWLYEIAKTIVPYTTEQFVSENFVSVDKFTLFSRNELKDSINGYFINLRKSTLDTHPARCCEPEILTTLMKLCCIFPSENGESVRRNTIPVICNHREFEYVKNILPHIDSDERDIAELPFKHLIENVLLEISLKDKEWIENNSDYVLTLHSALSPWNEYYNRNTSEGFASKYGSFPNRLKEPCLAKDLKRGVDIPEELFNLYQEVKGKNLKEQLVDNTYESFYNFTSVDAKTVATEIEMTLEEGKFSHEVVLDIINHLDDSIWQIWFPHITEKKADLFLKQVRPECKEGVFKLMKINDPDKINKLAELANEVNLDDIIRQGKAAVIAEANKKADFEYKKYLGQYVEDYLQIEMTKQLTNAGITSESIRVENEQYGHDLVVFLNNKPIYFLEVKSRWTTDQSVMMSPLQMISSVEKSSCYALCCVDMTGVTHTNVERHEYPPIENTLPRIKVLTNIGTLNEELIKVINRSENDTVHIGGDYKCIVPQEVIKEYGEGFHFLVTHILSKINRHSTAVIATY